MGSLPSRAQAFLAVVYAAGLLCAAWACIARIPYAHVVGWQLAVLVALAVLAGGKKIDLTPRSSLKGSASMSLGYALSFAALMRFGPAAGVLVKVASVLASCLYPKRQPLYQLCFNLALAVTEGWIAGLVFVWLDHSAFPIRPVQMLGAVVASCLTSFFINTGGVAAAMALSTGRKALRLWNETFLWTAPSYFTGAFASTLAVLLFGRDLGMILLFISPAIYLTYQSYAVSAARVQEKQRHLEEKQQHIEDLQRSQESLADLYLATIKSLALAIDAKDQYTHQHILRVQRYAVATAKHMGITGSDLEAVNTGALLHDIGKLGVPEYVLLKPGRLTDEEFAKIKKHPEIGAAILDPVEFPWPVLPVVKYHHEHWDGSGYPEGLRGEAIPLTARILAVGDVYDALTSQRSYRSAWSREKALELIKREAGTHFDPVVVQAFLEIVDEVTAQIALDGQLLLALPPPAVSLGAREAASKAAQAAHEIHRASSELWALYEVAQTLSSSLGLAETLEILGRKLEAILSGTACLFLLREQGADGQDVLAVRSAVGVNREFFAGARTLGAGSRSLTVARSRQTFLGEYDADDLLLTGSSSASWEALRSALIVPMVYQDQVLGTINLYHPQPDAFGVYDRHLLEMIAERAAMALYNGLLFDRTRSDALTDPLTGLYNLRYLTQHVEERCQHAARKTDRFALLCLDLDSFKPINDNFGHQKGDAVLRDLSRIFRATLREEDVVARYGGDEFLIVLEGAGPEEATAMAGRLQAAVEGYDPGLLHPRLGALRIGVSIGHACFPRDGYDCTTLISEADSRMYQNKIERKLGTLAGKEKARAQSSLTNV